MTGDPDRIAFFLLKSVARTCKEFDLLTKDDRVAVAVSGGKDSRALLDLLLRYRRKTGCRYELLALHVVGTTAGFPDLQPELEPWFLELGVEYHFAPLELPSEEPLPLDCFRCSWNRRKALFTAAAGLGCNKLAFGHHADDAAATMLLNLMFNGKLETMAPRVEFFDSAVTIIRPLIYIPEKELVRYGQEAGFPEDIPCPQGQKQIRANLWRTTRQAMGF